MSLELYARLLVPCLLFTSVGFPAAVIVSQTRVVAIVPIVGSGSWHDPKRPAFVPATGSKGSEHSVLADDGQSAIVDSTGIATDVAPFSSTAIKGDPTISISVLNQQKKNFKFAEFFGDTNPSTISLPSTTPAEVTVGHSIDYPASLFDVSFPLHLGSSGGEYDLYLSASANAEMGPSNKGTYVGFTLSNPTFTSTGCTVQANLMETQQGVVSLRASALVPCKRDIIYHAALLKQNKVVLYAEQTPLLWGYVEGSYTSSPKVAGRNVPATNTLGTLTSSTISHPPPDYNRLQHIRPVFSAGAVTLNWAGAIAPVGVGGYFIYRDGVYVGRSTQSVFMDSTIAASQTYKYSIAAFDVHALIGHMITFSVTTPAATASTSAPGVAATSQSPDNAMVPTTKKSIGVHPADCGGEQVAGGVRSQDDCCDDSDGDCCDDDCDGGDGGGGDGGSPPIFVVTATCSSTLLYRPVESSNYFLNLVNHSYVYQKWDTVVQENNPYYPPYEDTIFSVMQGEPELGLSPPWGRLVAQGFYGGSRESLVVAMIENSEFQNNIDGDPTLQTYYEQFTTTNAALACPVYTAIQVAAYTLSGTLPYNPTPLAGFLAGENSNYFAWYIVDFAGGIDLGTPPNAPGFPNSDLTGAFGVVLSQIPVY